MKLNVQHHVMSNRLSVVVSENREVLVVVVVGGGEVMGVRKEEKFAEQITNSVSIMIENECVS